MERLAKAVSLHLLQPLIRLLKHLHSVASAGGRAQRLNPMPPPTTPILNELAGVVGADCVNCQKPVDRHGPERFQVLAFDFAHWAFGQSLGRNRDTTGFF